MPCRGISPTLLSRFVPAVIEQSCLRVSCMTFHQYELVRNVVEVRVFMKRRGVLCIERLSHVEAVEPHLRRINLLMPEAAFRSARVSLQLLAQSISSFLVLLLFSHLVKQKQDSTVKYIVQVVVIEFVGANRSIVIYKMVNGLLYELEIVAVGGSFPNSFQPAHQHALIVIPFIKFRGLVSRRIFPERHCGCSHALGQRLSLRLRELRSRD